MDNDERTPDILIEDDFYQDPEAVRALALSSAYANIERTDYPGFASQLTIGNDILKKRFEKMLGERIVVDPSRFTWGGFRFITTDTGSRPKVHADAATDWAAMVYLTPDAPANAGTGFYQHKVTGFNGPPSDRAARLLGYADSSEYDDCVIDPDKMDLSKWICERTVTPVYNRLVLFRGAKLYHAPLGGCGSDKENARLTHIFFFNTVGTKTDRSDTAPIDQRLEKTTRKSLAEALAMDIANMPFVTAKLRSAGNCHELQHAREIACNGSALRNLTLVCRDGFGEIVEELPVDLAEALRAGRGGIDLSGADLDGLDLSGANLTDSDLRGTRLRGARLRKADLSGSDCRGAEFGGADLYSASLKGCDLTGADLSRTDLRHADLRETKCDRTALRGADLWNSYTWGLDLGRAYIQGVDFARADDLSGAVRGMAAGASK